MEVYATKLQLVESYLTVVPSSTSSLQRFGLETDFGLEGWAIGDTIDAILFESEIFSEMLSRVKYNASTF